jgi:membrane protein implicated in regulation of membrane protease activity
MDTLIGFLETLTIWHWWGLAAVLLVFELLTGTTYLLWPTAAASLVGLLAAVAPPFGWEAQLVTFAVVTAGLTWVGDRYFPKIHVRSDRPTLNERAEQLAGQKVIATVDFVAGRGRVRLGDSVWGAVLTGEASAAQASVASGAVLEVVGLEGATLRVKLAS